MFESLLAGGKAPNIGPYTRLNTAPGKRSNVGMVAYQGKLYMVAGGDDNLLWIYTPETDSWESKATPLPAVLSSYVWVVLGSKIYLFGGWNGSANLGNLWEYTPATDTWVAKTAYTAMSGCTGFMALVQGEECLQVNSTGGYIARYRPSTNAWTTVASGLTAFIGEASGQGDDGAYILFGGRANTTTPSADLYWMNPANNQVTKNATPTPNPGVRDLPVMTKGRDKLYMRGSGPTVGARSRDLWEYTATTNKWRQLVAGGLDHALPGLAVLGTKLYIYGGQGSEALFFFTDLVLQGSLAALSPIVGPGPTTLTAGDANTGLFGTVASTDFFSGSELATAVGITTGTLINDTIDWFKVSKDGQTLYFPKKAIRIGVPWATLDSLGIRTPGQNKLITKNGKVYRVRLMTGQGFFYTGASGDDVLGTADSEYNRFIYRLVNQFPNSKTPPLLGNYTLDDLGLTLASNGCCVICQEGSGSNYIQRNGGSELTMNGTSWNSIQSTVNTSNADQYRGWRPVLELVGNVGDPFLVLDPSNLQAGSTLVADSSGYNTPITNSGVVVSDQGPKLGMKSLYFNNSAYNYLRMSGALMQNILSGDFTMECYLKQESRSAYCAWLGQWQQTANLSGFIAGIGGDGTDVFSFGPYSEASGMFQSANPNGLAWEHIVYQRSGNTFTIWRNGVQVATISSTGAVAKRAVDWLVGGYLNSSGTPGASGSAQFNGWISKLRVYARAKYTATFTPD